MWPWASRKKPPGTVTGLYNWNLAWHSVSSYVRRNWWKNPGRTRKGKVKNTGKISALLYWAVTLDGAAWCLRFAVRRNGQPATGYPHAVSLTATVQQQALHTPWKDSQLFTIMLLCYALLNSYKSKTNDVRVRSLVVSAAEYQPCWFSLTSLVLYF